MENKIVKYIFVVVVGILLILGIFQMRKEEENDVEEVLDKTSTASNIQENLRFAICNFDTANPILSNNRNIQEIFKIVYEPLITLDNNYKKEYCLATEIAKIDDLTYVVKLRENVKWQDGSEVTSDDVKYTVDLIKSGIQTVYSSNVSNVSGLEKIDKNTLNIYLSQKEDFFEYNLTFPILHKIDSEENQTFTGTGMFEISSIDSNVINLKRNDNYWNKQKKPMAEEININLYNSAGEMYTAFKNGDIDILNVKIDNVEELIGNLGYKKTEYRSRDYDFLVFNTQNKVLGNSNVRKAISKMIDKDNIVASCLGQGYVASNFSLDMGQWLYTKNLNITVNPDEATQILVNDGWSYKNNRWSKIVDGIYTEITFSLTVNSASKIRVKVAENIKNQLANYGINVNIKQVSGENYQKAFEKGNFDTILAGITCGFSPNLSTFFGENNLARYSNQEVADIMKAVSSTNDENILYEKYNRIYDIYLEEVPYIGLYRNTDSIVCNQNFVGNIQPNSFNIYYNVEKWYRQ